MFKPDVGCFNMLIDAYGKSKQWTEAEKSFHLMKKFQCVPTVTTFNVLMAAYSRGDQLERAENLFHEMKDTNYTPGTGHDEFLCILLSPYFHLTNCVVMHDGYANIVIKQYVKMYFAVL